MLAVCGLLVFRPLVRRVRQDLETLRRFNETLEQRVADRTALAEQRADALAVSEALYRSLVDHLSLHVNRKDLQGRFTFANDSFCQFLGKTRAEILGRTNFDFFPAETAEIYRRYDQQVVEGGKIFQALVQLHDADGATRQLEMLKTPVGSAGGGITGTQTVYLDVTDRIEAESRLAQSERLAAIGNMVAAVAHESRNSLQQMQACTGLLKWKVDADKEALGLLADLEKAEDRLRRLFEDLRGYAAPQTLEHQSCDLHHVIEAAWVALAARRESREAALQICASPIDLHCRADPLRLEQVFRNIMENSLDAADGPLELAVEFAQASRRGKPALRITIRDNGPGFTLDGRHQALEPFYTTKTDGTGLGLAIVRRIVEAHDGEIEIGNRHSRGAEIRIILPKGKS